MSNRSVNTAPRGKPRDNVRRGQSRGRNKPTNSADFFRSAPKGQSVQSGQPLVLAHIRVFGIDLDQDNRTHIRRRLDRKLGKFATSIERVSVRLKDVNGPRGGVDQACRIKVVLRNFPSVVFEKQDVSLDRAVSGALVGVERSVRRSLQRRRSKPIKKRETPLAVPQTEFSKES